MKAMVLAAGKGERFSSFHDTIPKPMARLGDKPVLEHVIDHLRFFKILDIIINLHHLPRVIMDYFGDGAKWGVAIKYSLEPELLGTAGAILKVADELKETFLVYYGDNLCECDLGKLRGFHRERGGLATIVTAESYDDIAGGVVECAGDGRLIRFVEKPAVTGSGKRWENGGIYILEPDVINCIPESEQCDFARDIFPALLEEGERIYCYKAEGYVRGIDTPERYERIKKEIEEGRLPLR